MDDADRRADVVVVGAGPAGSSAAWHLARAGLDVVALTDHDGLCGSMEFAQAAAGLGIRPGCSGTARSAFCAVCSVGFGISRNVHYGVQRLHPEQFPRSTGVPQTERRPACRGAACRHATYRGRAEPCVL